MKIKLLSLLLLVIITSSKGQTFGDIYSDYYKGLDFLKAKNYVMADSFLTEYGKNISPLFSDSKINDYYYNLSLAKLGQNDTMSFCDNMHRSSLYFNDREAFKVYCAMCVNKIDSQFFDKKYVETKNFKSKYILITYYDKFQNQTNGRIIDTKYRKPEDESKFINYGNIIGLYYIVEGDTIYNILNSKYAPSITRNGGMDFYSFVRKNLKYPEDKSSAYETYKQNIISINIKILINQNGHIEKHEVLEISPTNVDEKYINEAVRIVYASEEFLIPGNMLGKNVKAVITCPIQFIIKEN